MVFCVTMELRVSPVCKLAEFRLQLRSGLSGTIISFVEIINYGNLQKNIYLTERYQCTYSTNSTNEIIVPERLEFSWSWNSASLQRVKSVVLWSKLKGHKRFCSVASLYCLYNYFMIEKKIYLRVDIQVFRNLHNMKYIFRINYFCKNSFFQISSLFLFRIFLISIFIS
jgi:hypothetical protein